MRVEIEPASGENSISAYGFPGDQASIADGSTAEADTITELVLDHPNRITEQDRLHFVVREVTATSRIRSRDDERTGRSNGEILVRIDRTFPEQDHVDFGAIPLFSSLRGAQAVMEVYSIELELKGVLKCEMEDFPDIDRVDYVPIDELG